MVYQWKTPLYPVNAQEAGEELERISSRGSLTPENVVEESRPKDSVLHDCFEWNDAKAAENYRKVQAGDIIRNIVTISIDGAEVSEPVRAFVSIADDYKPITVVVKTQEYTEEMLQKALKELHSFQRKYSSLEQLSDVFKAIDLLKEAG